ncbi:MAG: L,D-transpeptidase, partial [Chthoniobacterales bacterium]|nr:L,D-transpeptidase [Chthoniobacterales bacterium]
LDRANFGPGKIDGYYGDFTTKALALYRQSRGEEPSSAPSKEASSTTAPDTEGLDLASVDPVFITYTVTEADLAAVGELPAEVEEKAKLKWLPYTDPVEAIAEKFHADRDFIVQLNPGISENLQVGDEVKVPNVEPFDLEAVKEKKDGEPEGDKKSEAAPVVTVKVRSETNMLELYEDEKLTAAYPVTIGASNNESPAGDWKVKGVALLPTFRHDESMLKRGERSSDFHMLQPGPNNPVGVTWIALDKDGIGLHGTDDPDAIGRASSAGCVRLANWDVVRLLPKVTTGVAVSIQ